MLDRLRPRRSTGRIVELLLQRSQNGPSLTDATSDDGARLDLASAVGRSVAHAHSGVAPGMREGCKVDQAVEIRYLPLTARLS